MATHIISGNIGGTAGSGAQVSLRSQDGVTNQSYIADASGNYTFTVPDLTTYIIRATLANKSIRAVHQVAVSGADISNVNFQIFNLTDSNSASPGF